MYTRLGVGWIHLVLATGTCVACGESTRNDSGDAAGGPSSTVSSDGSNAGSGSSSSDGEPTTVGLFPDGGGGLANGSSGSQGGNGGSAVTAGTLGGTGGVGGVGDTNSAGGVGATDGTTGPVASGDCEFTVEHAASPAIPTVRIVTWSTDLADVIEAHIEVGPETSGEVWSVPVDLNEPEFRTLLVGLKGKVAFTFRVVATSATSTCTSPDYGFRNDPLPEWVPTFENAVQVGGGAEGFIVTTSRLATVDEAGPQKPPSAFILDADGYVVWWTPDQRENITAARISWDAKSVWYVSAAQGSVFNVSMDGLTTNEIAASNRAHHDLAPLPEGGVATLLGATDDEPAALVEIQPDGTMVTIVSDLADLYVADTYDPQSIQYHPDADSFTLSDSGAGKFVMVKRNGELVWQLGGDSPLGDSFELTNLGFWTGNLGHHLTAEGHLLFYNKGSGDPSIGSVSDMLLDEADWTATQTWNHVGGPNDSLGDVQRLPNGNTLIALSGYGIIREVTPAGDEVQRWYTSVANSFGYTNWRSSLYGPPLR